MERKDIISRLNDISGEMNVYLTDATLKTAVKEFNKIEESLNTLLDELEEEENNAETAAENKETNDTGE